MLNTRVAPWPSFESDEIDAVTSILQSGKVNYWTGDEGRKFENELAEWSWSNHAIVLANGTLALDVALRALGIGPGDEVIVTPRTFIASVSSVVNAGAIPVFADVDRNSGNISPETIAPVITNATRCIVPVHLGGWPCDMTGIMALAASHGLSVVEDCAQAHGAWHAGRPVGSFGQVGAWSFCQDKILSTAGEGGAVTTSDKALWESMWSFKDHGKSYDAIYARQHPPGFRWIHESFGTNWRMPEIQSAIGRIQLRKLPIWTERRARNANILIEALSRFAGAIRVPLPDPRDIHAWYRLYAYIRPENLKSEWSRDRIVSALMDLGAPAFQGSCGEVYREKAFEGTGYAPSQPLPNAHELGETSLAFLVHPTQSLDDVMMVADAIGKVLPQALR